MPDAMACRVCGRDPAQVFSFRRHVGMLVVQQFVKVREAFCREHAQQLTKAFTLRTLWQGWWGWWGYISFFVNWFVLAANANMLVRANRMGAPRELIRPGRLHGPATRLLTIDDAPAVKLLLRHNRSFLAPWQPIRDEHYFTDDGQREVVSKTLQQHAEGNCVPLVIQVPALRS